MGVVDRVEPYQRGEKAHVGLREMRAAQPAAPGQAPLQPVERGEQRLHRLLVLVLRGGEAGAIDAVVDGAIDALVEAVDLGSQRLGIQIGQPARGERVEIAVQHAQDLGRLVVDDGAGFLVPEDRHGHPPGVAGLRLRVQLVQIADTAVPVLPAVLEHAGRGAERRHGPLQTLHRPHDQRAMRPGTGLRDVEAIAALFHAARRDETAKSALRPDERAACRLGVAGNVPPYTVDHHAHERVS